MRQQCCQTIRTASTLGHLIQRDVRTDNTWQRKLHSAVYSSSSRPQGTYLPTVLAQTVHQLFKFFRVRVYLAFQQAHNAAYEAQVFLSSPARLERTRSLCRMVEPRAQRLGCIRTEHRGDGSRVTPTEAIAFTTQKRAAVNEHLLFPVWALSRLNCSPQFRGPGATFESKIHRRTDRRISLLHHDRDAPSQVWTLQANKPGRCVPTLGRRCIRLCLPAAVWVQQSARDLPQQGVACTRTHTWIGYRMGKPGKCSLRMPAAEC